MEKAHESKLDLKVIGGIIGIVAAVVIYFLPLPLEPIGKISLALSVWLLIWLVFQPIASGYTGLIFICFMVLLKFAPGSVFTWFTISAGWFQVASFIIAAVMVRSGLAKRMAYLIMYKLGANTVPRFLFVSVIVVFLLILLVPSPTALVAITIPLAIYVAEAWNLPSRSESKKSVPEIALVSFFLLILCGQAGTWIKTGFSLNLLTLALSKVDIEWMEWFKLAAPLIWFFGFLAVVLIITIFRPSKNIIASKDVLKAKVDELGPLTSTEKKVIAIMSVVLILFVTESYHKISPGWIALCSVCVFAMPQLKIFKSFEDAIGSINWSVMFFITALNAMVSALNSSGASQLIAEALSSFQPSTVAGYYATSSLVGTFATSILGVNLVQGVIIPIFVGWSQVLGLTIAKGLLAIWLPAVLAGNLLPPLIPTVIFAWTFKYKGEKLFTFGDGFKIALVAYLAYYIAAALSQLTYWNLI